MTTVEQVCEVMGIEPVCRHEHARMFVKVPAAWQCQDCTRVFRREAAPSPDYPPVEHDTKAAVECVMGSAKWPREWVLQRNAISAGWSVFDENDGAVSLGSTPAVAIFAAAQFGIEQGQSGNNRRTQSAEGIRKRHDVAPGHWSTPILCR